MWSFEEPSTCIYKAQMESPVACECKSEKPKATEQCAVTLFGPTSEFRGNFQNYAYRLAFDSSIAVTQTETKTNEVYELGYVPQFSV